MNDQHLPPDGSWVPDACTLPTAEQPLRLAEFDQFFQDAVRRADRLSAYQLRLHLDGAQQVEQAARELTARESSCCSFFLFDLVRTGPDSLTLDVRVPAAHVGILDALSGYAACSPPG